MTSIVHTGAVSGAHVVTTISLLLGSDDDTLDQVE